MPDNRNVKCDGCGKSVDMYYCSRTLGDNRWLFFCKECETNGTWAKVVNKAVKDEKQKSGA